jgi:hypothetical protein
MKDVIKEKERTKADGSQEGRKEEREEGRKGGRKARRKVRSTFPGLLRTGARADCDPSGGVSSSWV